MTRERLVDLAAEQGVLAGLIAYGGAVDGDNIAQLTTEDFSDHRHSCVFRAVNSLRESGEPVDELNICSWLERNGQLKTAGGHAFVSALADAVIAPVQANHYAGLVKRTSVLRGLANVCAETQRSIAKLGGDPLELAGALQNQVMDLTQRLVSGQTRTMGQVVPEVLGAYQERSRRGTDRRAVSTGIGHLDRICGGGFRPGQYIIMAGRPSMGKTAAALKIMMHVAVKNNLPVLGVNLEQGEDELVPRMICAGAKVNTQDWTRARLNPTDLTEAIGYSDKLKAAPIHWLTEGAQGITDIAAKARAIKLRHGLGLVVVDYIGLLTTSVKFVETELSAISRQIKREARALGVPWLVLSQLNREVEKRTPPKPMMADLRSSGSLENDADMVLLLYREGYYTRDPQNYAAEIIVGKHRNGPVGVIPMLYFPEYTAWEEREDGYDNAY